MKGAKPPRPPLTYTAVDPADVAAVRAALPEALVVGAVVRAEGETRVRVE